MLVNLNYIWITVNLTHFFALPRTLRLWMTCDRYEKATLLDKMLTLWYPHTHLVLFFGFLVYAMQHPQELPLPVIMQLVAYFLTSVTYYSGCLSFFFSRVQMTQLIRLVNEKNYAILNRPDASQFRSKSNQTYFGMVVMAFVFSLSGVMSALPVVIKLFTSGDVLFKTPWHNDFTPHGWQAITQNLLHTFSIAALAQFSALHWTIFIEVYVRVAWYFQILADDFRALRKDSTGEQRVVAEALEEMKLKNLLREYQDLRSIVGLANGIISVYLNAFVTLVYVTMGMVVALIASLDSTWAAAQFMFFPLYQYFLLATLCYLGQHVMDAVTIKEAKLNVTLIID